MSFLVFRGLFIASNYVILIVRQISKFTLFGRVFCIEDGKVRVDPAHGKKTRGCYAVVFCKWGKGQPRERSVSSAVSAG